MNATAEYASSHGRGNEAFDEGGVDLVPVNDNCPRCGERRIDMLIIDDDRIVACQCCGYVYELE